MKPTFWLSALVVVGCLWATASSARAAGDDLDLTADGCAGIVDLEALTTRLALELRVSISATTPAPGRVAAPTDACTVETCLAIECRSADAVVTVDRRQPARHAEARVPLAGLAWTLRPRILALLAAELLRTLESEPPAHVMLDSPPPPVAAPTARHPRHALRNLAVALGVGTVASVIVGGLFATHDRRSDAEDARERAAVSGTAFGFGGLCLTGGAVDLGFWLSGRARPDPELPPASSPSRSF